MTRSLLCRCLPAWFIPPPPPATLAFIFSATRLEGELNLSAFSTEFWIPVMLGLFVVLTLVHILYFFHGDFFPPLFSSPPYHPTFGLHLRLVRRKREVGLAVCKIVGCWLPSSSNFVINKCTGAGKALLHSNCCCESFTLVRISIKVCYSSRYLLR